MDQRAYDVLTASLFLIVAALYLLRINFGWPAGIGGLDIPMWASWLALVVTGGLAYLGFRLSPGVR
jgi:TRAP-type C4-dicarboxylate transport system permease small subunit